LLIATGAVVAESVVVVVVVAAVVVANADGSFVAAVLVIDRVAAARAAMLTVGCVSATGLTTDCLSKFAIPLRDALPKLKSENLEIVEWR
jgi:hypothetical protein